MLHFTNAYEDGDEIVLDGFLRRGPAPVDSLTGDKWQKAFRFLALTGCRRGCTAGGFDLVTAPPEERADDSVTEFGMINPTHAGSGYRYAVYASGKTG